MAVAAEAPYLSALLESDFCSSDMTRNSCYIPQSEYGKRDSIAVMRGIVSILSIIGAFSIIISVIVKKQVLSPKIHPIFILSIADFFLATLWTIGGVIWLTNGTFYGKDSSKSVCFVILLATVILECVTVNLTCVYAVLAYYNIKQKDFSNVYTLFQKDLSKHIWKPSTTIVVYCIAWLAPVLIILIPFFAIDRTYHLTERSNNCACWCVPYFGNIMPHSNGNDLPTSKYLYDLSKFILCYSIVICIHYMVGFCLLLTVYGKVLVRIKKMRTVHRRSPSHRNLYGATEAIIVKGQSQAKTRVMIFLTTFLITGFFNVILSALLIHYALNKHKLIVYSTPHRIPTYAMVTYIFQSISIPLQGFLNAIIYGWTREDFVKAIRTSQNPGGNTSVVSRVSVYKQNKDTMSQSVLLASDEDRVESSHRNSSHRVTGSRNILHTLSEQSDSD